MPTIEGGLLRNWRKTLGITQEALGASCPEEKSREQIRNVENGPSSASISTLLNLIRGLERAGKVKIGSNDAQRLVAFFQGPDLTDELRSLRRHLRRTADLIRAE